MKDRFISEIFFFLKYLNVFSSTNNMTSIILKNQECVGNQTQCTYNRTFKPKDEEIYVLAITNATLAVFFDVLENVEYFREFNNENSIEYCLGLSGFTCFTRKFQSKFSINWFSKFSFTRCSFY
jgi:hypothetical protein